MLATAAALGAFATAGLGAAAVALLSRTERSRQQRRRERWLAPLVPLLHQPRHDSDVRGFPVLRGESAAGRVRLAFHVDHYAPRTLPTLLLELRVTLPVAVGGERVSCLFRPRGMEAWTDHDELPALLATEPDADVSVRATAPRAGLVPAGPLLDACDAANVRQVSIDAAGITLVCAVATAERSRYLLLRQAEFPDVALAPPHLARLLELVPRIARGYGGLRRCA